MPTRDQSTLTLMTGAVPWWRSRRCRRVRFVVARCSSDSQRLQTTDYTAQEECQASADREDHLERLVAATHRRRSVAAVKPYSERDERGTEDDHWKIEPIKAWVERAPFCHFVSVGAGLLQRGIRADSH